MVAHTIFPLSSLYEYGMTVAKCVMRGRREEETYSPGYSLSFLIYLVSKQFARWRSIEPLHKIRAALRKERTVKIQQRVNVLWEGESGHTGAKTPQKRPSSVDWPIRMIKIVSFEDDRSFISTVYVIEKESWDYFSHSNLLSCAWGPRKEGLVFIHSAVLYAVILSP